MKQTKILPTINDFRDKVQSNEVEVDVANDIKPEIEFDDSYELGVLETVLA
jgi:hypothetical protein